MAQYKYNQLVTQIILFYSKLMQSSREYSFSDGKSLSQQFQKDTPNIKSNAAIYAEARVYQLHQVKQYNDNRGPIISKNKKLLIEEKLQLDKVAERVTDYRIRKEEYFVPYGYNPFVQLNNTNQLNKLASSLSGGKHSHGELSKKSEQAKMEYNLNRNLVEAVNEIKSNNFKRNNDQLLNICEDNKRLSTKIKQNAETLSYNLSKAKLQKAQSIEVASDLTFDQILKMDDENYFYQHQKNINIFTFMKGKDKSVITNQVLNKFNFNFGSMIQKMEHFRVPIFRDLSRMGRSVCFRNCKISKNARLDLVLSSDLTIKLNDIRFSDLTGISSGRINPQLCYSLLYDGHTEKQFSPKSSMVSIQQIDYDQNKNQRMMNHSNLNDIKQDIIDYKQLENTPLEDKYLRKCNKAAASISQHLKQKSKLCNATIHDKQLHSHFDKLINEEIHYFVDMDNKNYIETDRLIRQNKTNKNRSEQMKIKKLLNTIVLKNGQQKIINQLMHHSKK